jgi:hypothetical protein
MNIDHIITTYKLDRQRLHAKMEDKVKDLLHEHGVSFRKILKQQYDYANAEMSGLWRQRTLRRTPTEYESGFAIPRYATRAIIKSEMRNVALRIYLIKYGIKYANRLFVTVS